jgi:hypothetical protein
LIAKLKLSESKRKYKSINNELYSISRLNL